MREKRVIPLRLALIAPLAAAALAACGGGSGGNGFAFPPTPAPTPEPVVVCPETGPYACKSGESEPLYTFQWALNYLQSYFQSHSDAGAFGGGIDLNVEPVHRQGFKGQGVNVLVFDGGVDLSNEDLQANADRNQSWNFETGDNDPDPMRTAGKDAHGTAVAGIISASQNGKGVMGLAPRATLGGVTMIGINPQVSFAEMTLDAHGGAPWSKKADVINASYGVDWALMPYLPANPDVAAMQALKGLRGGKGAVFVRAAANSFDRSNAAHNCGPLMGLYDCTNPGNDPKILETNAILVAALNARGRASSYSSAGSVVWITGMGGEFGQGGRYGEHSGLTQAQIDEGRESDGPTLFTTDIRGCANGYSRRDDLEATEFKRGLSERVPDIKDNPNCDYTTMNGTSSAAPTIAGITALLLSANPDLSWRDVRDILRLSARAVDPGYEKRTRMGAVNKAAQPYGARFDLRTNSFTSALGSKSDITAGSTRVPVELGWTVNAAGNQHANWYGFGVPDAAKAAELALLYKKEPARGKPATQVIPAFQTVNTLQGFDYQQVSLIGEFRGTEQIVDQFQLRLSGQNICLGSLGLAVQSPAGTMSLLKMPLDHFALGAGILDPVTNSGSMAPSIGAFNDYGAGSYAFYGERAQGTWKVFALASNPVLDPAQWEGRHATCAEAPSDGLRAANAQLRVEARVIAQ